MELQVFRVPQDIDLALLTEANCFKVPVIELLEDYLERFLPEFDISWSDKTQYPIESRGYYLYDDQYKKLQTLAYTHNVSKSYIFRAILIKALGVSQ